MVLDGGHIVDPNRAAGSVVAIQESRYIQASYQATRLLAVNPVGKAYTEMSNGYAAPYVEILEQPKQRGMRFRYECEGRSAGSLPGQSSGGENKSYPTIKIHNHKGPAVIVVSCVTANDTPHRAHPHSLVGKDCNKGVCTLKVKDSTQAISFHNIGIQCCKKRDVNGSLTDREKIRVDPYQAGFSHRTNTNSAIDLNTVRLCWQVFLPDATGKFTRIVPPISSHIIYDKKSINDLVIVKMSRASGRAKGGDEIFILCEKVNKEDIEIRFFEGNDQNVLVWEAFGDFTATDVHRQYAIVFRSPAYHQRSLQAPAEVLVELRRKTDGMSSHPLKYTYIPDDLDPYNVSAKRKRKRLAQDHFMEGGGDPSHPGAVAVGSVQSEEPYAKLPSMVADAGEALLALPGAIHGTTIKGHKAASQGHSQPARLPVGGGFSRQGDNPSVMLGPYNPPLPPSGSTGFGAYTLDPEHTSQETPLFGSIDHLKSCDEAAIIRLISEYQDQLPSSSLEYIQGLPTYSGNVTSQHQVIATNTGGGGSVMTTAPTAINDSKMGVSGGSNAAAAGSGDQSNEGNSEEQGVARVESVATSPSAAGGGDAISGQKGSLRVLNQDQL